MKNYCIGCNYWSSKSAMYMWREWDESVIDSDFKLLSQNGINVLRIFPLWPDFQPITKLYGPNGSYHYGFKNGTLPDTPAGKCGIDELMLDRFDSLVAIAQKYNLKLIVGLLTGWMSSQLFVPSALEGINVLTNPEAIKWEIRFVKYFVSHYADCKTIAAWDLGNECNNMGKTNSSDESWLWCNCISDAIRVSDPQKRPVISGLHGLTPDGGWKITDQGEICDGLTTHPYPCFTPFCNYDRINSMRVLLHSTCESLFYANLSGKPCIIEEIGSIYNVLAGEKTSAQFAKATIRSAWANGINGYMWWCNHDFDNLNKTPYIWNPLEQDLGLVRSNGKIKKPLTEVKDFAEFLNQLPFEALPQAETDGYILVGKTEQPYDAWKLSFNSYVLAKQAGINMNFSHINSPLPEASLYILPCVSDYEFYEAFRFEALMQKVYDGATLYVSLDDPYINAYEKYFGASLISKYNCNKTEHFSLDGMDFNISCKASVELEPATAEVLAVNKQGDPCLLKNRYGKGTVYLLTCPLENHISTISNAPDNYDYYKIYSLFAPRKEIYSNCKNVCLTKHNDIHVAINYSDKTVENALSLNGKPHEQIYGDINSIKPFDICVFKTK